MFSSARNVRVQELAAVEVKENKKQYLALLLLAAMAIVNFVNIAVSWALVLG